MDIFDDEPPADADGEEQLTGTVKSYNGIKGYGFISSDQCEGDVFFSRSVLATELQNLEGNFFTGRACRFQASIGSDGRQRASKVDLDFQEGQLAAGTIKTYSSKNGYGFIKCTGLDQDIHFKGDAALGQVGAVCTFRLHQLPDGKLRAQDVSLKVPTASGAAGGMPFGMAAAPIAHVPMMPQVHPGMRVASFPMAAGPGFRGTGFSMPAPMPGPSSGCRAMPTQAFAPTAGQRKTGVVKSFNANNGYGFINVPGHHADFKFGIRDITPGVNDRALTPGTSVTFTMKMMPDGRGAATDVGLAQGTKRPPTPTSISRALPTSNPAKVRRITPQAEKSSPEQHVGQIKSFNLQKGYGFINADSLDQDVFFMKSDIVDGAEESAGPGQAVHFELVHTPDGKFRAQRVILGAEDASSRAPDMDDILAAAAARRAKMVLARAGS